MAKANITLSGCRSHRLGDKVYNYLETFPSSDPKEIAYCEGRKDIFTVSRIEEKLPVKKADPPPPPVEEQDEEAPASDGEKASDDGQSEEQDEEAVGRPGPAKRGQHKKKRVKVDGR